MRQRNRGGRPSLFSHKVSTPVSVKFTKRHHAMLARAQRRLTKGADRTISTSDVLALLVETYADVVTLPPGKD